MSSDQEVPGILFITSGVKPGNALTSEVFDKWYDTVHIPDLVATSGINAAFRYEHVESQGSAHPYMAIYPIFDIAFVSSPEIMSVPLTHPILPEGSNVYQLADFIPRVYIHLKTIEASGSQAGPGKFLYHIGQTVIEGAEGSLFEKSDELVSHLQKTVPGFRRARLFKLAPAKKQLGIDPSTNVPTHLTTIELDTAIEVPESDSFKLQAAGLFQEGGAEEFWHFKLLGAQGNVLDKFPE